MSDSRYASVVTAEWRALPEEWTQWWGATLPLGPIVLVYDSSGNQVGAQRRAYGKRDVDGRPRVRLASGNPATKGDESKTREDIEAGGTATSVICYHSTFHIGLIPIHTTLHFSIRH